MEQELFGIASTVLGKKEWQELEKRADLVGTDQLLNEILEKRLWSNAEIAWVLKLMVFYYGKKDNLLKKMPVERLFLNMVDVLRTYFLIIDNEDPELDDNVRAYISSKLADSTWGINQRTRGYLEKI
ncbi:Uncharacterized [Syntrophomonas zehnderi OL-4]|uniref:Uncharacterized n=1 Tax=Syntrophomonas zehnderi OL-4 TaxID=690567 RepID=A0A0E4GBP1_9FIRM|nr:hypothetical protein [Syntrophomonas zehnderi]CFX76579.1 Uncharacterized [Syntrophomonas zehnderi OL-4]